MSEYNSKTMYSAFKTKDSRFDGKFFIGIKTTGIYCRPVCHARLAKEENCEFFDSAALAEFSGYRPCLLCRPELAPSISYQVYSSNIATQAAQLIDENISSNQTIEDIANQLYCSERHLRRVFKEEFGVSPIQYRETKRLLLAKQLLSETNLKITEVAMSSGFGSLRRFNDVFKKQYHLSPSGLRKLTDSSLVENQTIRLKLSYRTPYLYEEILSFLELRAIGGIEVVRNQAYYRTIRMYDSAGSMHIGWIKVSNDEGNHQLLLEVSNSLLAVLPQVIAKTRNLFDLNSDPYVVADGLTSLSKLDSSLPKLGLRLPGCFDPFEIVIRAVLGQQISVKAARTITSRIIDTYALAYDTGIDGLTHIFLSPAEVLSLGSNLSESFGPLGVIATRANTIHLLAEAFESKELQLHVGASPSEQLQKLQSIKGIGVWTAGYIVMRAMQWPDIFLESDIVIKNAFPNLTQKEIKELSKEWSPWRSYAVLNIWSR